MRFAGLIGAVALVAAGAPALAQNGAAVAVPPAPVLTPAPAAPVAPRAPVAPSFGQVVAPSGADDTGSAPAGTASALGAATPNAATAQPGTAATPAAPDAPAPVANTWLPAGAATLGVLNKVDGSTQTVTIAPGAQATVGDLIVSVQSCLVRPADQLPDAAVFISVQPVGSDAGAAGFRGWMIRSAPGATVVGDAGETFRVIGCA
jgi:hypothetical protein